jgi:hypothetical protein
MSWKYGLVLSALVVIAGVTPTGANGESRPSQEQRTPAENEALAVVQNYFELAVKTDPKDIVNITMPMPKGALKKPEEPAAPEPEPPPDTAVVMEQPLPGKVHWTGFEYSFRNQSPTANNRLFKCTEAR